MEGLRLSDATLDIFIFHSLVTATVLESKPGEVFKKEEGGRRFPEPSQD